MNYIEVINKDTGYFVIHPHQVGRELNKEYVPYIEIPYEIPNVTNPNNYLVYNEPTITEHHTNYYDYIVKIDNYKTELSKTDFKILMDYTEKYDGELLEVKAKRAEIRKLLNSVEDELNYHLDLARRANKE